MALKDNEFSLKLTSINVLPKTGKKNSYPLLTVTISGAPRLTDILEMMKRIKDTTRDIKEEYISVTDFSKLDISNFLTRILFTGLERMYKHMLFVQNPAVISFVILGAGQEMTGSMKNKLKEINESSKENVPKYNYVFINDPKKIPQIAGKLLASKE